MADRATGTLCGKKENRISLHHTLTGTEPQERVEGMAGVLGRLLGRR